MRGGINLLNKHYTKRGFTFHKSEGCGCEDRWQKSYSGKGTVNIVHPIGKRGLRIENRWEYIYMLKGVQKASHETFLTAQDFDNWLKSLDLIDKDLKINE